MDDASISTPPQTPPPARKPVAQVCNCFAHALEGKYAKHSVHYTHDHNGQTGSPFSPASNSSRSSTPSTASRRLSYQTPPSSLQKPRWNGTTIATGISGHNFKPSTLTTPSPYARSSPIAGQGSPTPASRLPLATPRRSAGPPTSMRRVSHSDFGAQQRGLGISSNPNLGPSGPARAVKSSGYGQRPASAMAGSYSAPGSAVKAAAAPESPREDGNGRSKTGMGNRLVPAKRLSMPARSMTVGGTTGTTTTSGLKPAPAVRQKASVGPDGRTKWR